MPAPPWALRTGVDVVLHDWLSQGAVRGCFTAHRSVPAAEGSTGAVPPALHPSLHDALARRGIHALYDHQREAIEHARTGGHVVVATPTASGKSLCFHLPVLDAIARDGTATALYLYPTKALSRDQEASFRELIADAQLGVAATVYDGDTPGDARRSARQHASVVMTNPDMLHAGILPQHPKWARLLANLRYVVVDELHTYRGVFGSHVAHVLGRLRRAAAFHGASPTFIAATATIGNPRQHAARLFGVAPEQVHAVERSTAPRGERVVLVYNPPVVNAELGMRASYVKSAVRLATDLIRARVRTMIFGPSRNSVEIMLKYLRDAFAGTPSVVESIVAYRGGYLPETRRRVERGLRNGDILCVVATSALELGIDVGDLDAVVCAGYAGSIAETWQRFGRAGRRGDRSLAVLVASSAPLDQFVAQQPSFLLDGAVEQARIDPHNTEILVQHLKCAAFELPFREHEPYGDLPADHTEAALGFLQEHGVVHAAGGRYHWAADAFPANHVSLRRIGWDNFVIVDTSTGNALAELDWHSAPGMLHEQAIYQHDGAQYQVEKLDYDNHKAFVRPVEPDYFTTAMRTRQIAVLEREAEGDAFASGVLVSPSAGRGGPPARVGWGEICVTEKIVGYKKIKFHTHENAGYGDIRLPDIEMHTTSFWLVVPRQVRDALGGAATLEGLRGVGRAMELVATLALMCDPHDLGQETHDAPPGGADGDNDGAYAATAFLFDNVPSGVGLAERIWERADELLLSTARLIAGCGCAQGCPGCVGPPRDGGPGEAPSAGGEAALALETVPTLAGRKANSLALLHLLGLEAAAHEPGVCLPHPPSAALPRGACAAPERNHTARPP